MRLISVAALLVMAACADPAVQAEAAAQKDEAECAGYGLTPGSENFAQCRMLLAQARAERDWQRRVAAAAALQGASDGFYRSAARPVTTTCTPGYGRYSSVSCTSW